MSNAYEAGQQYAKSIKVGDEFVGAGPASEDAGFGEGQDRRDFIKGALDYLEDFKLLCDRRGDFTFVCSLERLK